MQQEFVAFFAGMEAQIRESGDLPWLVATIDEGRIALQERGFTLRADAFVFLYVNLRVMVVLPSVGRQVAAEDAQEMLVPVIRGDIGLVFGRVMQSAGAEDEAVSANAVFQAIGELSEQLAIRADEFWGP